MRHISYMSATNHSLFGNKFWHAICICFVKKIRKSEKRDIKNTFFI